MPKPRFLRIANISPIQVLTQLLLKTFHELMRLSDDSLKEIDIYSLDAPQTRKSLVKGERFIRSVWRA